MTQTKRTTKTVTKSRATPKKKTTRTTQTKKKKETRGRPTKYSEELVLDICEKVRAGSNLDKISRLGAKYPARSNMYKWLKEYEFFREHYTRAREDRADLRAEKIEKITQDVIDGKTDPKAARVAIDALKWLAGKEKPLVYGEKIQHSGDKEAPLNIILTPTEANL